MLLGCVIYCSCFSGRNFEAINVNFAMSAAIDPERTVENILINES